MNWVEIAVGVTEMWKTNVGIMKNWLRDYCGILKTLGYDYELGHSEVCGIIACIITLLLFLTYFLLCHRAVVLGNHLILVANRVIECNIFIPIFFFIKMKKQRNVISIFGMYKIGMVFKSKE